MHADVSERFREGSKRAPTQKSSQTPTAHFFLQIRCRLPTRDISFAMPTSATCPFPFVHPPQCVDTLAEANRGFYQAYQISYASSVGLLTLVVGFHAAVFFRRLSLSQRAGGGNLSVQTTVILLLCLECVTFIVRAIGACALPRAPFSFSSARVDSLAPLRFSVVSQIRSGGPTPCRPWSSRSPATWPPAFSSRR
jgi:hypothetical protein